MIALDTNVLVRLLVEDDRAQAARARGLVEREIARGGQLFVSAVVLCETVWVLSGCYRVARADVVQVLLDVAHTSKIVLEDNDGIVRAIERFHRGRGDFADYVIHERAGAAGCSIVATFDRELLREEGFEAP